MRPACKTHPWRADSDVTIESHFEEPVALPGCKVLKLQRFMTRSLASGLLPIGWKHAGVGFLLVLSGCLIPQESRILEPVPAARNRPPRILEEVVTPPRVIRTGNGPNCRLDFEYKVEDPDVEDNLTTRWYIYTNFDPNLPAYREGQIPPDGKTVRDRSATLSIDFAAAENPLRLEGVYAVEGLVSDGTLINRQPQPRHLPGGDTDPTYAVSYAWVVIVTAGSCPP